MKRRLINLIALLSVTLAVIGSLFVLTVKVLPEEKYKKATSLMHGREYYSAAQLFLTISDYRDSAELAVKCEKLAKEADYYFPTDVDEFTVAENEADYPFAVTFEFTVPFGIEGFARTFDVGNPGSHGSICIDNVDVVVSGELAFYDDFNTTGKIGGNFTGNVNKAAHDVMIGHEDNLCVRMHPHAVFTSSIQGLTYGTPFDISFDLRFDTAGSAAAFRIPFEADGSAGTYIWMIKAADDVSGSVGGWVKSAVGADAITETETVIRYYGSDGDAATKPFRFEKGIWYRINVRAEELSEDVCKVFAAASLIG